MFPEANNNLKLLINNTPINTIIFDFDGTLAKLNIDFHRMRREILELVLSYGIKESDLPAEYVLETISYVKNIIFLKSQNLAAKFNKEANDLIEQIEMEAACHGELFSNTRDLLKILRLRKISTGIVTRNCQAAVHTVFPDILDYCPVVVCREAVRNVKPHPEQLNKALEMIGANHGNSLMIGDHPLDIKSGLNAGIFTAGVLTGNFHKNDFAEAGAHLILSHAGQILDIIS